MDTARRSKRYPSEHPLLVRCDSWTDFVSLYAGDIGQGGMFIVTDDPPPILSVIDVRLQLPEAVEIAFKVRVVHVLEKEQVMTEHMRAGVGVEFVDLDPERKRQIHQLIEFARWQGHDPNASLQRTMLEHSNSVSQSKKLPETPPLLATSARAPARADATRITMDGTSKAPAAPARVSLAASPAQDARKITLDGTEKTSGAASKRSTSSLPAQPTASLAPKSGDSSVSRKPISQQPAAAAKPSDAAKVKVVMTHFAHKRYDIALKEVAQMLVDNPGDVQALKWQCMCKARQAIAAKDNASAAQHYEKALEHDENTREARDFVRDHHRDKRLAALPFGRYFTKKK